MGTKKDTKKDLNDRKALEHHNKTINVTSGAWNERNFSNEPNKPYDGFDVKQDQGEPIWKWFHDIKRKKP